MADTPAVRALFTRVEFVQFIPSVEYAIPATPPFPYAAHLVPSHTTDDAALLNGEFAAVQVVPLEEYASVFVPAPAATHFVPFHATELQYDVNTPFPEVDAVQLIPSDEYTS